MHFLQSPFLATSPFLANSIPYKFHFLQIHMYANFGAFSFTCNFQPFPCKFHSLQIQCPPLRDSAEDPGAEDVCMCHQAYDRAQEEME